MRMNETCEEILKKIDENIVIITLLVVGSAIILSTFARVSVVNIEPSGRFGNLPRRESLLLMQTRT